MKNNLEKVLTESRKTLSLFHQNGASKKAMKNISRTIAKTIASKEAEFLQNYPELAKKSFDLGYQAYGKISAPAQCIRLAEILKGVGYSTQSVIALSGQWNKGYWKAYHEDTFNA